MSTFDSLSESCASFVGSAPGVDTARGFANTSTLSSLSCNEVEMLVNVGSE